MEILNEILEFEIFTLGDYTLKVSKLITILLILMITKIALWLFKKALFRRYKFSKLDAGSIYAMFQIIKYIIWVIAIAFILETIGIKITFLLAGSAALLVGVGLGLQQTFNDVI